MLTRTQQQQENVSKIQTELGAARAQLADLKKKREDNPADSKLREAIRRSLAQVNELEEELESAKEDIEGARLRDASDEGKVRKATRKAKVDGLLARCEHTRGGAAKVDAAVPQLLKAVREFASSREEAKAEALAYTALTDFDGMSRRQLNENFLTTPGSLPYSFARLLHKLAQASGLQLNDYVTFNLSALNTSTAPMSMAAAAEYLVDRVASTLAAAEEKHNG